MQRNGLMPNAEIGDTVKIHYTGYLKDGTVFDSTVKQDPVVFTIGKGTGMPGIEKAVIGMKEEDVRSVTVLPKDAYGEHKKDLVTVVERTKLSGNIELELGMKLRARTSAGIVKNVTVRDISDTTITVDANHPLAGQELTFEILLLEIMKQKG
jgi:peptidylprolyl isomerase